MKKILAFMGVLVLMGAFLLVQHAPFTTSSVSTASPLIVIDPGHGGWDPGAVNGSLYEKSLTLAVALKLGDNLQQRGYRIYYTRHTDTALSSTVMNDLVRRVHVTRGVGATIFISIHANAEPTHRALGPIVYYPPTSSASLHLASQVEYHLASIIGIAHAPRPIRQWVLLASPVPAINVEIGFLTHTEDSANLQSPPYQQKLALAITQGVSQYLSGS